MESSYVIRSFFCCPTLFFSAKLDRRLGRLARTFYCITFWRTGVPEKDASISTSLTGLRKAEKATISFSGGLCILERVLKLGIIVCNKTRK